MWNPPTKKQLEKIPALYATDGQPLAEKIIHQHFFIGSCDWYVCEYDPNEDLAFGYAVLNDDLEMSEWGYISLAELRGIKVGFVEVDREIHWTKKPASEIERIVNK